MGCGMMDDVGPPSGQAGRQGPRKDPPDMGCTTEATGHWPFRELSVGCGKGAASRLLLTQRGPPARGGVG